MQTCQSFAKAIESVLRRFYDQEPFVRGFDLVLPAVNRFDPRDYVDAGSEMAAYERVGDGASLFERNTRRENDSFVGHIKLSILVSLEEYEDG